jgi:hypothetical protein
MGWLTQEKHLPVELQDELQSHRFQMDFLAQDGWGLNVAMNQ